MYNKKQFKPYMRTMRLFIAIGLILINMEMALAQENSDVNGTITDGQPASDSSQPTDKETTKSTVTPSNSNYEYSTFNVGKYLSINKENEKENIGIKGSQGGENNNYRNKSKNPVGTFILQTINLVALTSASLSFLAIVVAGFLMISSAGDEGKLSKGKDILTRAIIGLVITLSSYFIVSFIQNLLFEHIPEPEQNAPATSTSTKKGQTTPTN